MGQFEVANKTRSAKGLRVLMQNRPNALVQRGGDTLVMENTAQALRNLGIDVLIDLQGQADPAQYDLVHLFNFALPDLLRNQAQRAKTAGVPFVVTSLCEDVPTFHNQSHAYSSALIQYVHAGQDRGWWKAQEPYLMQVQPSSRFDNDWVVQEAGAILSSGAGETMVLQRNYPGARHIVEVPFGFQGVGQADAGLFVSKYGVSDFVFCVGRLESRKNQLMLLKALEDSALTVVLAGGDFTYQPAYADAVRKFKRRGRTVVLNWLTSDELASAYQAARIHTLASWYELPGLVSIESARQGRNIVATDTGSTKDYLGDAAFYCKPNDEQSIFNAVMAAYYAPKMAGLEQLPDRFTWQRTAEETLKVYQKTLGFKAGLLVEQGVLDNAVFKKDATDGPIDITNVLESAEHAAQERDFEKAISLFKQAQELDPVSVRALRGEGAVLLVQEHFSEALSCFQQALKLKTKDSKTLSGLGMVKMRLGQPEQAYSHFLTALEIEPYQLVTILQLVDCCYTIGQYDQLEKVLRNYLSSRPEDLNMHFCLAGCLFKQGKLDEAAQLNDKVLKEQPLHSGAVELRILLAKRWQEQEALQGSNAREVKSKLQTTVAASWIDSGAAQVGVESKEDLHISGEFQPIDIEQKIAFLEEEKAKRNYERVLQESRAIIEKCSLNGQQREKLLLLQAEALTLSGEMETATKVYDIVLQQDPRSCRGLCGKAVLAAEGGDWDQARMFFEQAHAINSRNDLALAGLGMCQRRVGENEQAWKYYQLAQSSNPENMRALLGMIELAYPLKRCGELEMALEKYLDMHPADLDFVYALAGCYYTQEKFDQAISELDKIALFNPAHEKACELREIIGRRLNGGTLAEAR